MKIHCYLLLAAALVPWSTAIGTLDFENKRKELKKMNKDLTRQFISWLKTLSRDDLNN